MAEIRILALVQKAHGIAPNQRFRHEQWAPYLSADHGIRLDFAAFESPPLTEVLYKPGHIARKTRLMMRDVARRWRARHAVRDYDAVVVLREAMLVGGAIIERAVVAAGIPLIYDFDDVIWQWVPGVNGLLSLARVPSKVGTICRLASAVTVGNEYLADYARQFNSDVSVVRTSIDEKTFPAIPAPGGDVPFTVAWTGSHTTLAHLETIRPAIEQLGTRVPTRLRVVCDVAPPPFEGVELDFVRWQSGTEAADLAPAHVGVMPLTDTPLTRGKCGCKALQYMAIGRPAVVSPVGINREIVRDGENGMWAETMNDWTNRLETLARDPALRERLACAGRRTVLDGFTARKSATAFAAVARRAIARTGRKKSPSVSTPNAR